MSATIDGKPAGKAILDMDHKVHEAMDAAGKSTVVKALGTLSEVADQPQLRLLCGLTIAAGLWRADPRLAGAGLRMLLAHELATAAKGAVKHRVDRRRPRSAVGKDQEKPRAGSSRDKEDNSFPSGHSAGALSVATAFSAAYPQYRVPALLAAGGAAAVQVPRCAHYPTDVGAGLAIGAAAGGLVTIAWRLGRWALGSAVRSLR